MQIGRPIVEAMQILGSYLPTMDDVRDLLESFQFKLFVPLRYRVAQTAQKKYTQTRGDYVH